jgi:hypothetical protein
MRQMSKLLGVLAIVGLVGLGVPSGQVVAAEGDEPDVAAPAPAEDEGATDEEKEQTESTQPSEEAPAESEPKPEL